MGMKKMCRFLVIIISWLKFPLFYYAYIKALREQGGSETISFAMSILSLQYHRRPLFIHKPQLGAFWDIIFIAMIITLLHLHPLAQYFLRLLFYDLVSCHYHIYTNIITVFFFRQLLWIVSNSFSAYPHFLLGWSFIHFMCIAQSQRMRM